MDTNSEQVLLTRVISEQSFSKIRPGAWAICLHATEHSSWNMEKFAIQTNFLTITVIKH